MQISPHSNIPFYGTMPNTKTKEKQDFSEQKTSTLSDKTLTVARNTLLAGMLEVLTNCTNTTSSISTQIPNEPNLPSNLYYQISRTKQGNGVYIDIVDGQKYIVKYTDDGYKIGCPDGSVKFFNYKNQFASMTEEKQDEIVNFLEKQNGAILSDLASECAIFHYMPISFTAEGIYIPYSEKILATEDTLVHELMHAIDCHDTGTSKKWFSDRKEFIETLQNEYRTFLKSGEKFIDSSGKKHPIYNRAEFFAEAAACIVTGGKYGKKHKKILETYFPQSTALVKKYIKEARRLPQFRRMPYTTEIQQLPNAHVKYILYKNKQMYTSETYNKNKKFLFAHELEHSPIIDNNVFN